MTEGYEQLKEKILKIIELTEKASEEIRATLCQALIEELRTAQTLAGTIEPFSLIAAGARGSNSKIVHYNVDLICILSFPPKLRDIQYKCGYDIQ